MAFGWEVRGPTGKIVADSNSPNLMAVGKGTLTLDQQWSSTTNSQRCKFDATDPINMGIDAYRGGLTRAGKGELIFFEVPNGHRVHTLQRETWLEVWSSTSTLRWVRARFMRFIARPADTYGIEVRDSAGRLTYHSGATVLTMLGTIATAPAGAWVAPETNFLFVGDSGQAFIPGVDRTGGVLTAQGFKAASYYAHVTGNYVPEQRVRGLVAAIDWNEV